MQTYQITIGGMGCEHCLHAIRKALSALTGVEVVEVSMGSAVITTEEEAPEARIRQAVEDAGYDMLALDPV